MRGPGEDVGYRRSGHGSKISMLPGKLSGGKSGRRMRVKWNGIHHQGRRILGTGRHSQIWRKRSRMTGYLWRRREITRPRAQPHPKRSDVNKVGGLSSPAPRTVLALLPAACSMKVTAPRRLFQGISCPPHRLPVRFSFRAKFPPLTVTARPLRGHCLARIAMRD